MSAEAWLKGIYQRLGNLDITVEAGATSIADGDDATQGALADAAVTSNAAGSLSAKLRGLVAILSNVWDQTTSRLNVTSRSEQYTTVASGELAGAISATQMPSVACKLVRFKAHADNVGKVYLGAAGVTVANGITDTTTGLQLAAGDDTGWLPVDNLDRFWRICDNASDDLTYLVLA